MAEIQNEVDLWQILRMHISEIGIWFKITPHYGYVFYICEVEINANNGYHFKKIYQGRNLYKRYAQIIKDLTKIYGENLYKHNEPPLHLLNDIEHSDNNWNRPIPLKEDIE